MSKTTNKFSPEFRERAVRMVDEHRADYGSEWAAMTSIADNAAAIGGVLFNLLGVVVIDGFWDLYRTLDHRGTVRIEFWLLLRAVAAGPAPGQPVTRGGRDLTTSSIALTCVRNASSAAMGKAQGPSHFALLGSGCASRKRPAMPTAIPARASAATCERRPSALSLRPPGFCKACVTSNTTGAIGFMMSIPSMSTTRLL